MISRRGVLKTLVSLPIVGVFASPATSQGYELIHVRTDDCVLVELAGKACHSLNGNKDVWHISTQTVILPIQSSKQEVDKMIQRHLEDHQNGWIIKVLYNKQTNKYGVFAVQE